MLGFCHVMGLAILSNLFRKRINDNSQDWGTLHQNLAKDFFVSRFDTNEVFRIFNLKQTPPSDVSGGAYVPTIESMDKIKGTTGLGAIDAQGKFENVNDTTVDLGGNFFCFFLLVVMDTAIYEWLVADGVDKGFEATYIQKFGLSSNQLTWFKNWVKQSSDAQKATLRGYLDAFQLYRWTITLVPSINRTRCTLSHTYASDYVPFDVGELIREDRRRRQARQRLPTSGRQN